MYSMACCVVGHLNMSMKPQSYIFPLQCDVLFLGSEMKSVFLLYLLYLITDFNKLVLFISKSFTFILIDSPNFIFVLLVI